jgi:hypothetical protein
VTFAAAALDMWNMGLGFVAGVALWHGSRRGWLGA